MMLLLGMESKMAIAMCGCHALLFLSLMSAHHDTVQVALRQQQQQQQQEVALREPVNNEAIKAMASITSLTSIDLSRFVLVFAVCVALLSTTPACQTHICLPVRRMSETTRAVCTLVCVAAGVLCRRSTSTCWQSACPACARCLWWAAPCCTTSCRRCSAASRSWSSTANRCTTHPCPAPPAIMASNMTQAAGAQCAHSVHCAVY